MRQMVRRWCGATAPASPTYNPMMDHATGFSLKADPLVPRADPPAADFGGK